MALHADASRSLAGPWQVRIDEADQGLADRWFAAPLRTTNVATLPGALAQSGLGHRFDPQTGRYEGLPNPPYLKWPSAGYTDEHRRDELGVLVARHMTYGPAWFERTVDVPTEWAGRRLRLSLERVKWASQLWVDGQAVTGRGTRSLHAPHVHDLGELVPGPHRLTLRIDNRPQVHMGFAGHGYGMETEPLWLGVAGELRLTALDALRVEHLTVSPASDFRGARLELDLAGEMPATEGTVLTAQVIDPSDSRELGRTAHRLSASGQTATVPLTIEFQEAVQGWDEFNPKLYEVRWTIAAVGNLIHNGSRRVGFRTFQRQGRRITLNGSPVFLRGNLDCAIHPDSQTPPTDRAWWERVLGIHKQAGFNHLRFHTWCPPDAAFDVADELGLYLQVETAYWVDDWVSRTDPLPHPFGRNEEVDAWIEEESFMIIRQFEHHPSFAMFCLGNEFGMTQTDWGKLQELVERLNAGTDHALVSGTTARRSLEADEYWVTHNSGAATRGLGPAHTDWDFARAVDATDKPVISHETGQRPSWPDYSDLLPRFEGVMRPWNLRLLQARGEAAGCTDHARRAEASARFALIQYKQEHEAMRRTPDLAGYQLLMLHDFTGQGEAHVGLLDPFYREKPGITLEEIRRWNGPTVPLARFDSYTWSNADTFKARFQVAHEGSRMLGSVTPRWSLTTTEGRVIDEGSLAARDVPAHALTDLDSIELPLNRLESASALRLSLEVAGFRNHWNLWVYPATNGDSGADDAAAKVEVVRTLDDEALAVLEDGGNVVLLPYGSVLPNARRLSWASTYWTGAWGWGNGMGLLIDAQHPALAVFPTAAHSDWQWRELAEGGLGIALPAGLANDAMIVEQLADFHLPAREGCIFETRVGPGKLLVCGLDLSANLDQRHAARALRNSLLAYAGSKAFNPRARITPQQAATLLRGVQFGEGGIARIEADSSHPGNSPENVLDGNPETIWHTPWGSAEPPHPHHLVLDLGEPRRIAGLHLLPRQDSSNGRFKEVAAYVSADGQDWGQPVLTQNLPAGSGIQTLSFAPLTARFLKIEVLSETSGRPWASLAELAVIDGR